VVKEMTQLNELQDGMKRVSAQAQVVEKGDVREIKSRFKDETYRICDAIIADESGSIKLTLWNEQIEMVQVGDRIVIDNGYVTSFRGEIQLNVGKFGTMKVVL
jgi:replication factor A1